MNNRDKIGRFIGEKHYKTKLSDEHVKIIYQSFEPTKLLAKKYNVSSTTINGIRQGVVRSYALNELPFIIGVIKRELRKY